MGKGSLVGLAEAYRTFDGLPDAARDELAVEMGIIGREVLAAQRADVAKDTGTLESTLSLQVLLDALKVRIGLFGRSAGRRNGRARKAGAIAAFYGRFVEFGRRAQTVLVTRTARRAVKAEMGVTKRNRGARKAAIVARSYSMKVTALAPRPFVQQPLIEQVASSVLSDYWARVLARVGS